MDLAIKLYAGAQFERLSSLQVDVPLMLSHLVVVRPAELSGPHGASNGKASVGGGSSGSVPANSLSPPMFAVSTEWTHVVAGSPYPQPQPPAFAFMVAEQDSLRRTLKWFRMCKRENVWFARSRHGGALVPNDSWQAISSLRRPETLQQYCSLFFGAHAAAAAARVEDEDEEASASARPSPQLPRHVPVLFVSELQQLVAGTASFVHAIEGISSAADSAGLAAAVDAIAAGATSVDVAAVVQARELNARLPQLHLQPGQLVRVIVIGRVRNVHKVLPNAGTIAVDRQLRSSGDWAVNKGAAAPSVVGSSNVGDEPMPAGSAVVGAAAASVAAVDAEAASAAEAVNLESAAAAAAAEAVELEFAAAAAATAAAEAAAAAAAGEAEAAAATATEAAAAAAAEGREPSSADAAAPASSATVVKAGDAGGEVGTVSVGRKSGVASKLALEAAWFLNYHGHRDRVASALGRVWTDVVAPDAEALAVSGAKEKRLRKAPVKDKADAEAAVAGEGSGAKQGAAAGKEPERPKGKPRKGRAAPAAPAADAAFAPASAVSGAAPKKAKQGKGAASDAATAAGTEAAQDAVAAAPPELDVAPVTDVALVSQPALELLSRLAAEAAVGGDKASWKRALATALTAPELRGVSGKLIRSEMARARKAASMAGGATSTAAVAASGPAAAGNDGPSSLEFLVDALHDALDDPLDDHGPSMDLFAGLHEGEAVAEYASALQTAGAVPADALMPFVLLLQDSAARATDDAFPLFLHPSALLPHEPALPPSFFPSDAGDGVVASSAAAAAAAAVPDRETTFLRRFFPPGAPSSAQALEQYLQEGTEGGEPRRFAFCLTVHQRSVTALDRTVASAGYLPAASAPASSARRAVVRVEAVYEMRPDGWGV